MLTPGLRCAPETAPMNSDDRPDHQARRGDLGGQRDHVAPEPRVDHPAAHGHEHQKERPEHLGEEAPPFKRGVREVEMVRCNGSGVTQGARLERRRRRRTKYPSGAGQIDLRRPAV